MNEYRQKKGQEKIHGIISFADNTQGHHGGVYQSMSWLYTGTSERLALHYTDETGRVRHARQNGVNISIKDAKERGWVVKRIHSRKYRYIKILGSKTERKKFRRLLKLSTYDYPKPDKKS